MILFYIFYLIFFLFLQNIQIQSYYLSIYLKNEGIKKKIISFNIYLNLQNALFFFFILLKYICMKYIIIK
jgi:hypothetical protein